MKTKIPLLILVLILAMAVTGAALTSGNIEMPRWVLSSGATDSSGGEVTLQGTLGQPVVGVVSSGDVTLGQGFWYGGDRSASGYTIYLPLTQR